MAISKVGVLGLRAHGPRDLSDLRPSRYGTSWCCEIDQGQLDKGMGRSRSSSAGPSRRAGWSSRRRMRSGTDHADAGV